MTVPNQKKMEINSFQDTFEFYLILFAAKFVIKSSSGTAGICMSAFRESDRNRRTAGLQWLMRAGNIFSVVTCLNIWSTGGVRAAHSGPEWIITPALNLFLSTALLKMCWVAYRRSFSPRRAGICSSIIHTSFHELTNNSDLSIDSLVLFRSALYYSRYINARAGAFSLSVYMYFEFARRRQRTFGTGWFLLGRFVRRARHCSPSGTKDYIHLPLCRCAS